MIFQEEKVIFYNDFYACLCHTKMHRFALNKCFACQGVIFHLAVTAERACSAFPCQNGALCSEEKGEYTCQCQPGWMGRTCEQSKYCGGKVVLYSRANAAKFLFKCIDHFKQTAS